MSLWMYEKAKQPTGLSINVYCFMILRIMLKHKHVLPLITCAIWLCVCVSLSLSFWVCLFLHGIWFLGFLLCTIILVAKAIVYQSMQTRNKCIIWNNDTSIFNCSFFSIGYAFFFVVLNTRIFSANMIIYSRHRVSFGNKEKPVVFYAQNRLFCTIGTNWAVFLMELYTKSTHFWHFSHQA